MNIFLYINGQLADFNEASLVLLNYAATDLDNPTIVRNSYTQAVTLPPTARNNAIFANIQRSDFTRGHGFDPIERTPFELRNERNEVLKAGYLKLDKFKKGGDYSVTLYGGLGEFFYSLMYNADGSKKTLADMAWYTENGDPGYINPKTHGLHGSAVDAIAAAWEWLAGGCIPSDDAPEGCDCFNFACTLEGKPSNFDAGKGYYTGGINGMYLRDLTEPGKIYGPQAGCQGIIVDLGGDHTSEEVQDINTAHIRNVWSVRAFFRSICNPAHNGGYTVELDPGFFNSANEYYTHGWVTSGKGYGATFADALTGTKSPADYLLGFAKMFGLRFLVDEADKKVTIMHRRDFYRNGASTVVWNQHISWEDFCTDAGYSVAQLSHNADGSVSLRFRSEGRWRSCARPTVPERHHCMLAFDYQSGEDFYMYNYDASAENLQALYFPAHPTRAIERMEVDLDNMWDYGIQLASGVDTIRVWGFNLIDLTQMYGNLWDEERTGEGYYNADTGVFVSIPGCGEYATLNPISVEQGKRYAIYKAFSNALLYYREDGSLARPSEWAGHYMLEAFPEDTRYIHLDNIYPGDCVTIAPTPEEFAEDYPRADYPYNPEGTTTTTPVELLDLSAVIDMNTAPEITPLLMSERYEDMQVDMVGENAAAYAEKYGRPYGRKRLDTSYMFDADKNKILTDGIALKGACDVLEGSPWFHVLGMWSSYDVIRRRFSDYLCKFLDCKWTLYWYDGDQTETKDCELMKNPDGGISKVPIDEVNPGNFFCPLPQIHGADNAAADGQDIPIFYIGTQSLYNRRQTVLYEMYLTETSADMLAANGGKACWNISREESAQHKLLHEFPAFRRHIEQFIFPAQVYTHSWDFAPSAEIYSTGVGQGDGSAFLYGKFWDGFLPDYYDADTRKMRCRVNLRRLGLPVDASLLRRFWAWDGAVWVLSKISNHSLTTDDLTECEFIRVKDIDNYTR